MKYNKQTYAVTFSWHMGGISGGGNFPGEMSAVYPGELSDENDREESPENIQEECPRKLSGWGIFGGMAIWLTDRHTDSF